ncbi:MAG TPA: 4-phosphoerythronate dehydrogenase [bacterium]
MNIVADEQIAFVREVFSRIGKVQTLPAGAITATAVRHADLLIIRSVTKVSDALLRGSRIRIIGTVTSGIDHVDAGALRGRRIKLIRAPGCNARAVAEYVLAGIIAVAEKKGFVLNGKTIGIIGVGHVGSLVARFCRAMGMKLMLNDPLLAARSGIKKHRFKPIAEILNNADIITLHVPLTTIGRYATRHMVNDEFFARLKKKAVLINTSRGAVIDENALIRAIRMSKISALVLDVWEHEPGINRAVLDIADIGTQHIAGHSFLGRLRGTAMVYDQFYRVLGLKSSGGWSPLSLAPASRLQTVSVTWRENPEEEAIRKLVHKIYDPVSDGRKLRKYLKLPRSEQSRYFERLRDSYPLRPEFGEIRIACRQCPEGLIKKLTTLGFIV